MAEIMVKFDDLRRYCENRHCGSVPLEYINQMRTVEAEPVKHGRWLAVSSYEAFGGDYVQWCVHGNPVAYWYCSECKEEAYVSADDEFILSDFCPYCGADMRGGDDNGAT